MVICVSMIKCGVCNKPVMVYIEQQVDDMFDKMVGDGEGTTCAKCGKEITVHQKLNILVFECPEHGVIARMEKRGYATWRCGCVQGYYAESKQQWWENESMRWIHEPPHAKKKKKYMPTFGAGIVVGIGAAVGDTLLGAGKKVVDEAKK